MKSTVSQIGPVIARLRKARHWSQGQVAYRAETSPEYISQLESGKRNNPSAAMLGRIALALDTTPDYILQETGALPKNAGPPLYSPSVRALQCALDSLPDDSDAKRHLEDIIISLGVVAEEAAKQAGEEPNERPHPTTDGSGSPTSHRQRTP